MEREFVRWLRERIAPAANVLIGPGDDAAVLSHPAGDLVITTDLICEGVDFNLAEHSPERVGRKALAVNLSDLAAMAARPLAAVAAVNLPVTGGRKFAEGLYAGMAPLAEQFGCPIVGGDTNSHRGPLTICLTVFGTATSRGPLRRNGARPGDRLLVTGPLGGSILDHHLDFTPRVVESLWLHERYTLHAGMDISDGLLIDLSRLCEESGCGAVLDLDRIPISDDAKRLSLRQGDNLTPLEHALRDGEDFELLLAAPPEEAARMLSDPPPGLRLFDIGYCIAELGIHKALPDSGRDPLPVQGFEHQLD